MSQSIKIILCVVLVLAACIIIGSMIRSRKGGRALLLTTLMGIGALCAVNLVGKISGVSIALNWYTIGASAIFGPPGVIGLLLLDTIFH